MPRLNSPAILAGVIVRVRMRFQVHQHVAQRGELADQLRLHDVADCVPLFDGDLGIDFDVDVGEALHAGAADKELFDAADARHAQGRPANRVESRNSAPLIVE